MCTCTTTDRGTDALGCDEHDLPLPPHDEEAGRQWELDHPNGISADELASMDRYAYESCREEHGDEDR